jgi:hypothetical protein
MHPLLAQAHSFHMLLMLFSEQCLCQNISNHFGCRNVDQFNEAFLPEIIMLWVPRQLYSSLVV